MSASDAPAVQPLNVYPRRLSTVAALLTPTILLGLGLAALLIRGMRAGPAVITAAGLVLLLVVVLDRPMRVSFDQAGVHRHCPLRHHTLAWDNVDRFSPLPARRWSKTTRGLVAMQGSRNYLLVDAALGFHEYAALIEVVDSAAPGLAINLPQPDVDVTPTVLYRRDVDAPVDRRNLG